jgi:hypothetical protein
MGGFLTDAGCFLGRFVGPASESRDDPAGFVADTRECSRGFVATPQTEPGQEATASASSLTHATCPGDQRDLSGLERTGPELSLSGIGHVDARGRSKERATGLADQRVKRHTCYARCRVVEWRVFDSFGSAFADASDSTGELLCDLFAGDIVTATP